MNGPAFVDGSGPAHAAAVDGAPDEALMQSFASGNARAFETLYARHRIWLYGLLVRQLGDRSKADDVFQDTWLTLVRTAPDYQPRARFSTWLYLLARQRLVDHWRRTEPDPEPLDAADGDDDAPADGALARALRDDGSDPALLAERRQLGQRLADALATLPAEQREAFLLAEHAGMTLDEIAVATASLHETVKSRLRYARRKLAALLAAEWN